MDEEKAVSSETSNVDSIVSVASTNMSIMEAILSLDCDKLLDLLPDSSQQPRLPLDLMRTSFLQVVQTITRKGRQSGHHPIQEARMIYLLRNLGAQINRQDENGDTALMIYLKGDNPHCDVVEALLRCNADVHLANKQEESPIEYVTTWPNIATDVKETFMKYVPGVWEAVQSDDAMIIRRLANQWCRMDVQKNGKTLLQQALEIGTENIIRVVSGIRPSMEFAHCVLAGDTQMVRRMLRLKLKINVNFRNMGDRGKTPLFYALQQGNTEMVQTLLDRGARVDITLKEEEENDIPLYFAALHSDPPITANLLKAVTPVSPIRVDSLYYKGCNILFYCIEHETGEQLIDFILAKGSAFLVTQRIENNRCPREVAEELNCTWIIQAIDNAVVRWMYQEEGLNRQILVLHGYQYIPVAIQNHQGELESPSVDTFYRYLSIYQDQIDLLHRAVEDCDEETVRHIIYFRHPDEHSLDPCLADSRKMGDGQPLLHKAVLRGSIGVVQILAETLVYQRKQRLDSVRDQFFRSALHYAYGMEDNREMINLLLDYGASEFTMDKDSRSPLAFKDRKGQELMIDLLQYQFLQDFTEPEPDPWTIPMPIPVINFLLTTCSHSEGQSYLSSQHSLDHLTGHMTSSRHLASLPNTELAVIDTSSRHENTLAKAHKFKSVSDTKLHKLNPSSKLGLAAQLAHFPDVLKSRLSSKRPHGKNSVNGVHNRDYLPLPMDNPDTLRDSEEDYEYEDDGADCRDLLDEKEMRKSSSCCVQ